jgi:MOB kinase activator 1
MSSLALTPPLTKGVEFPPDFPATVKQAYKLLFRIFAHIYHAHFETILHFQLEGHWNSLFAHFLVFGKEFELLDVGRDFFSSATGTGNTLSARQAQGVMGMGSVGVAQLWDKWTEMGIL